MGNQIPRRRNVFERLGDFFFSRPTPERAWKTNVALSGIMLMVSAVCIGKSGLVGFYDVGLESGDLSLSGTWKIKFDDRPEYARADLDDSDWCLTTVPGGGDPIAERGDHPANTCPQGTYPRDLMRNHTYWYRKAVVIPSGAHWEKPTIFLGNIKQEGWIYWDGKLVGAVRIEQKPLLLLLSPELVIPGRHELAVRTLSGEDQYPGLFHAYAKGVTLGRFASARGVVSWVRQIDYLEPLAAILFQFSALLILGFLAFRSQNSDNSFFWLAMYFGAAAIYACGGTAVGASKWLMDQSGIIFMSIALVGYSTTLSNPFPLEKNYINRIVLYFGCGMLSIVLVAYLKGNYHWLGADTLDRVIVYSSLVYVAFSYFRLLLGKQSSFNYGRRNDPKLWTYPVLGVMHILYAYERYFDGVFRASFFHLPILTCLVTIAVMLSSIEEHVHQERELAFLGRYIRRGLKQLLGENQSLVTTGSKLFRGRKIPIMKIDIVGHTLSTYGMPYGIKREFQDLWFTHIDEVVAGYIFLDKGQGDGSYYYFDETIPGGSCTFVLSAALRIIEHTVKEFDLAFRNAVNTRVAQFSELREPVSRFTRQYMQKTGQSFEAHETRVKIALVYGFVDEGLWGLPSQGHYDVEGDLLSLAARLEAKASEGEVVMSEAFVEKLIQEGTLPAGYELYWQSVELKGIGEHRFAVLRKKSVASKQGREVA